MKYLKDENKAKDMAMQVFEKLTDDLKKFDVHNFKGWLHTIVKNACLMYIRSDKSFNMVSITGKNELEKNMENVVEMHHNDRDGIDLKLEQLEMAMKILGEEQKQCIELFYLQEKSYKEVTEITGFSMNQVKSFIQNGKRNLKNYLVTNGNIAMVIFMCFYLAR
jgi:RNA polymerase sigma-70 factor (ECF subfamily)